MIFCTLLLRKIGNDLHCPFMFEEHENILCHLKVTKTFKMHLHAINGVLNKIWMLYVGNTNVSLFQKALIISLQ